MPHQIFIIILSELKKYLFSWPTLENDFVASKAMFIILEFFFFNYFGAIFYRCEAGKMKPGRNQLAINKRVRVEAPSDP